MYEFTPVADDYPASTRSRQAKVNVFPLASLSLLAGEGKWQHAVGRVLTLARTRERVAIWPGEGLHDAEEQCHELCKSQ